MAAIEPPAPPTFSMMNDCPSARPSSAPMVRRVRSRPPPGWAGTMIFTGFDGYPCAGASAGSSADATRAKAARRAIMMSRRLQAVLPDNRRGGRRGEELDQRPRSIALLGAGMDAGREHGHPLELAGQRADVVDAGEMH